MPAVPAGCTADAEVASELFGADNALLTEFVPVMFGTRRDTMAGVMRALASPGDAPLIRAGQMVRRLPEAARLHKRHTVAACQVAQMLSERLGVRPQVRALFAYLTERWDGKGEPGQAVGDQLPVAVRIAHVARDAAVQHMLGGEERATRLVRQRAGGAFDPAIAACLADDASAILSIETGRSVWEEVLDAEPQPRLELEGEAIDDALAAVGNFADLARAAARQCRFSEVDVTAAYRAALVHDVGRVGVPVRIWQKAVALSADDWERVRLHAYHSERILSRSAFLAGLASVGSDHHERLDGSGYHRGVPAAALSPLSRLLAASDAYHAMTEPRPHRASRVPAQAAKLLMEEAQAGRLDVDAVAAVVEAAGHPKPPPRSARRAHRSRGTGGRPLGPRVPDQADRPGDRHISQDRRPSRPERLREIGVSTRAAAALFAMEHGLATWGELPMGSPRGDP